MKVAIVHYWLVTMRGGEKVLEALLDLFPQADIYTHVYDPAAVSEKINSHTVYTSYINKLPLAKKAYQRYMPLMPNALARFNLQSYDLIISSESGPAKGIIPNPDAYHLCFCHSPMRYLWDMGHEYFRNSGPLTRLCANLLFPRLRMWDVWSANLVDRFITNSRYVAKRIKRYYNREAEVVFVPVSIENFIARERNPEDFYLFFGQQVGYKRADIAIEACLASGRKLIIAGGGADKRDLGKYQKSRLIRFVGKLSDEEARDYLSRARALLFPGIEDLGIIPIEANAAGCPVIAYRKGGALDTIKEHVTGMFFDEQNAESLARALDRFESRESDFAGRGAYTEHVKQFSKEAFLSRIIPIIEEKRRI